MKYSFFICLLWFSFSFSQTKDEKEERIPLSEFPKVAQNYFNNFSDKVKYLKFYRETDGNKKSFEAKFKIHQLYYSAEFDTLGKLEDIEIVIKKRHIPQEVFTKIMTFFDANYKKTRLLKIQKQYINHTDTNDKTFVQHIIDSSNDRYTNFEIIAETKTDKLRELSEFTFDKNGNFKSSRKVTSSSYEHALY